MIRIEQKKKWPWSEKQFKILDYSIDDLQPFVKSLKDQIPENKVIQIDGGGIRGVIPLVYLYTLEEKEHEPLNNYVKTFWGTSTGSIIAAGLACGVSARELLQVYVEKGPDIFHDKPGGVYNIFSRNSYKTDYIENLLTVYFGDMTFHDLYKFDGIELNISIVDIMSRKTVICNYQSMPEMYIKDAVRASISAPVYFGPYVWHDKTGKKHIFYDGGTGVFNSTLRKAVNRERYIKNINWDDFYVLSLGTGFTKYDYDNEEAVEKVYKWNKLKQFLWTFNFGREESVVDQVNWCEHRQDDVKLNFDRFNVFITKNIERMDETDNIKMLVECVEEAIRFPMLRVR